MQTKIARKICSFRKNKPTRGTPYNFVLNIMMLKMGCVFRIY